MNIICKKYYYRIRFNKKEYEVFITKQDKYLDVEVLGDKKRTEHGALYQDFQLPHFERTLQRMFTEHEEITGDS